MTGILERFAQRSEKSKEAKESKNQTATEI